MTYLKTAAFIATIALGASAARAETTELIFNNFLPPFEVTQKVAVFDFAERIAAESGGEIAVTIPDTSIAPQNRQYEMIADGLADMALVPLNTIPQFVQFATLAELPYNAPSAEAASTALWRTYRDHLEAYDEFKGLKVLSLHVLPGRHFMSAKAPISDISAFKGQRIWSPPGKMVGIVEGVGASPVLTQFADLYETVEKGMVDSLIITPSTAKSARVLDNLHNLTEVPGGLGSVSIAVVINAARWRELSEAQQAAILRAADGLPGRTGAALDTHEKLAASEAESLTVTAANDAFLGALAPLVQAAQQAWFDAARQKGLENPEAIMKAYRSALDAELD